MSLLKSTNYMVLVSWSHLDVREETKRSPKPLRLMITTLKRRRRIVVGSSLVTKMNETLDTVG